MRNLFGRRNNFPLIFICTLLLLPFLQTGILALDSKAIEESYTAACSQAPGRECFEAVSILLEARRSREWTSDDVNWKDVYINYFQLYPQYADSSSGSGQHINRMLENYQIFSTRYKGDESIPAIQLNIAMMLVETGRLDSALQYYQLVKDKFDGQTRYGTEALFYSGQIYYQQNKYLSAIRAFSEINSTVFIPVDRRGLNIRIAECRFRQMEEFATNGDTASALNEIDTILQGRLPAKFIDSIFFHKAEFELATGKYDKACISLNKITSAANNHPIYEKALYNSIIISCPYPDQSNSKSLKPYIDKVLSSTIKFEKKLVLYNYYQKLIIKNQAAYSIKPFFQNPFAASISSQELYQCILRFLRNSHNPTFQKELLSQLKMVSTGSSPNFHWLKIIDSLSNAIQLYEYYFQINPINYPIQLSTPLNLPRWELSLLQLIKGRYYKNVALTSKSHNAYADSAINAFTKIGELNSELSFAAAEELMDLYEKLSQQKYSADTSAAIQLGYAILKLKYLVKALGISLKSGEWENQLNGIILHENTRNQLAGIRGKEKQIRREIGKQFEMISRKLTFLDTLTLDSKKEIAFEILLERIHEQARLVHPLEIKAYECLLTAALTLYHGPETDNNSITKTPLLDHQARVGNYLITYLSELQNYEDTLYLTNLGGIFKDLVLKEEISGCYNYPDIKGYSLCYPLINLAIPLQTFNKFRSTSKVPKPGNPLQKYIQRENYLYYLMLCEGNKIRKLKSQLSEITNR